MGSTVTSQQEEIAHCYPLFVLFMSEKLINRNVFKNNPIIQLVSLSAADDVTTCSQITNMGLYAVGG